MHVWLVTGRISWSKLLLNSAASQRYLMQHQTASHFWPARRRSPQDIQGFKHLGVLKSVANCCRPSKLEVDTIAFNHFHCGLFKIQHACWGNFEYCFGNCLVKRTDFTALTVLSFHNFTDNFTGIHTVQIRQYLEGLRLGLVSQENLLLHTTLCWPLLCKYSFLKQVSERVFQGYVVVKEGV